MTQSLLVEPAFFTQPPSVDTLGPEVAEIASMAGYAPDPEQQLALDALFAFGPDGKVAAFEFAVICPRQNMKTGLFKMAALGWLFVTDQELIVWSAHEMKTTKEAFRDLENLITGCPALKARLADGPSEGIHRGNGEEMIELAPTAATPNGQRVMFKARTAGGGRGLSGDKVILDEAFALKASHMGSLLPTLSARPDPQVVYGSSAGLAESEILRGVRDRGRPGLGRLAYIEFCSTAKCRNPKCEHRVGTPGCAMDDPENWQQGNPQMRRRISQEYIAAEREALPPGEFGRERMGWWDDPATYELVIPADRWSECLRPTSTIVGTPSFALDVSPLRDWSCITAAGMTGEGLCHVEITGSGDVMDHRPGTAWVIDRLIEITGRWDSRKVTIQGGQAAEALAPDLEAAGIDVDTLTSQQMAQACGNFHDLATSGRLAHLGQPELNRALSAARRLDRDGTWIWGRKNSTGDITPIVGATLAAWAAQTEDVSDPSIYFV